MAAIHWITLGEIPPKEGLLFFDYLWEPTVKLRCSFPGSKGDYEIVEERREKKGIFQEIKKKRVLRNISQ